MTQRQIKQLIDENTACAERRRRTADYLKTELRGFRSRMSHISGFATLTDENIEAIGGVVFLTPLQLPHGVKNEVWEA